MNPCGLLEASLGWCEGKTVLPGIRRRLYYTSKQNIVGWPALTGAATGRASAARLLRALGKDAGEDEVANSFVLRADTYWKYIDIIADKSSLTSEAQGEYPSQTQLNKLTAVHPGVDEAATMAASYFNNNDCVFVMQTTDGKYRVIGNDMWRGKITVAQDQGQGATGTASTTINVEHTDLLPAPFYVGELALGSEEVVDCSGGYMEQEMISEIGQ